MGLSISYQSNSIVRRFVQTMEESGNSSKRWNSMQPSKNNVQQAEIRLALRIPEYSNVPKFYADVRQLFLESLKKDQNFQMTVQELGRALGCCPGGTLPSGHAGRYSSCHSLCSGFFAATKKSKRLNSYLARPRCRRRVAVASCQAETVTGVTSPTRSHTDPALG